MDLWDDNEEFERDERSNPYIDDPVEGLTFLTRILSIKNEILETDSLLVDLERMIDQEYMELSKKSTLPNEAEMYSQILKASIELEEIVRFPFLINKNITAVGGGFSAGKSQFVNSLIHDDILPTDTKPTTALPTFIAKGSNQQIFTLNRFGNRICINKDGIKAISHEFANKYNLSFTQLLKYIILQSSTMSYENITFLDTPGYSKYDSHRLEDNTDVTIAREHLSQADQLIWVIDIEKGTIPQDDIEFIRELGFQKPIFFILNKADKKTEKDIKGILKVAQSTLENAGIRMYDISAYSSVDGQEYVTNTLKPFLESLNESKSMMNIVNQFKGVFDNYISHHNKIISDLRAEELAILNRVLLFADKDTQSKGLKKLIQKNKKIIANEKELVIQFKDLSRSLLDLVSKILKGIEGGRSKLEKKGIVESIHGKMIDMSLKEVKTLKNEFHVSCDELNKNISFSGLINIMTEEHVTIETTVEYLNKTKWFNPLTWGKTEAVDREIPVKEDISFQYISSDNAQNSFNSHVELITQELELKISKLSKANVLKEDPFPELEDIQLSDTVYNELESLREKITNSFNGCINIEVESSRIKKEFASLIKERMIREQNINILEWVAKHLIKNYVQEIVDKIVLSLKETEDQLRIIGRR